MGRRATRQIELFYSGAVFMWILLCYSLGVYRARSLWGTLIVSIPVVIYALAFLSASRITKKVEHVMLSTDFLAFGLLFVSVLFEMRRHGHKDYTVRIIVVSFVLLILSTVDVWTGEKSLVLARHIRSAARTAAVTLLIFVIYVNVTNETMGSTPTHSVVKPPNDDWQSVLFANKHSRAHVNNSS